MVVIIVVGDLVGVLELVSVRKVAGSNEVAQTETLVV